MPSLVKQRKTLEEEMLDIRSGVDPGLEAQVRIFREVWDIRIAQQSIARTMESQNI